LFGRNPIFALLGSNGAGKTTIVKILTTLLKQDIGKKEKK
jgi:ABC-2 type transport system ATP-binding protein